MWNGEVKRSARLRQGGFVDAKSGDLHSSPCRPYMVLRSKRGGSDQTTYMFPRLSKCLNLDVYWAVKTQHIGLSKILVRSFTVCRHPLCQNIEILIQVPTSWGL